MISLAGLQSVTKKASQTETVGVKNMDSLEMSRTKEMILNKNSEKLDLIPVEISGRDTDFKIIYI